MLVKEQKIQIFLKESTRDCACLHVDSSKYYAKPLLEVKEPNFEVNRIILLASVHLTEINGEEKDTLLN